MGALCILGGIGVRRIYLGLAGSMMRVPSRIATACVCVVLPALAGCSVPPPNDLSTLYVGIVGDFDGLDPALHPSPASYAIAGQVMETLVRLRPGGFEIVPGIAQSWHVAADKQTWMFDLPPGAKFADGTPIDAAAVAANFDRWRNSNDSRHWSHDYPAYIEQFGGVDAASAIDNVYVVNPMLVAIHTREPMGSLLAKLTIPAFSIGSPAAMSNDRQVYEEVPTGNGPYLIADYVGGDHAVLERNPQFAATPPALASIVVRAVPDPFTSLLLLEKDDVDAVPVLPPRAVEYALTRRDVHVARWPSSATCYLAFVSDRAPFDSATARLGVAESIDKTKIATHFNDPTLAAANTFLPPAMAGYDARAAGTRYDPNDGRHLLAKARTVATALTLYYPNASSDALPDPLGVAQEIAAELRRAGLTIALAGSDAPIVPAQPGFVLGAISTIDGDPEDLMTPLLALWHDTGFAAIAANGKAAVSAADRQEIYRNLDAFIATNAGAVPLVHPAQVAGASARETVSLDSTLLPFGPGP